MLILVILNLVFSLAISVFLVNFAEVFKNYVNSNMRAAKGKIKPTIEESGLIDIVTPEHPLSPVDISEISSPEQGELVGRNPYRF